MLEQRRRWWPNIEAELGELSVLAGKQLHAIVTTVVFNWCYLPIKSLLVGIKRVFKHQHLQMFRPKFPKNG